MELFKDHNPSQFVIRSYEAKRLIVNDTAYSESVIITPHALGLWRPQSVEMMTPEDFKILIDYHPHIVLIGTGASQQLPPTALLAPLIHHQIGFEIMNTPSACRTYCVLSAEGRNVLAALIL